MTFTYDQLVKIERDPKTFLDRARRLNDSLDIKSEQIQYLRDTAESATVKHSKAKPGNKQTGKIVQNATCKMVDKQSELRAQVAELMQVEEEINAAIHTLVDDPKLQVLLELRYLKFICWEDIAEQLHYGYRWTLQLHTKALDVLRMQALRLRIYDNNII